MLTPAQVVPEPAGFAYLWADECRSVGGDTPGRQLLGALRLNG